MAKKTTWTLVLACALGACGDDAASPADMAGGDTGTMDMPVGMDMDIMPMEMSTDIPVDMDTDMGPMEFAEVRFVHLIRNAEALDIYALDAEGNLADTPLLAGIDNGEAPAYLTVPAGDPSFVAVEAGTTNEVLRVRDVDLLPDTRNSVALVGEVGEDGLRELAAFEVRDDEGTPAAGTARIRFIHGGSRTGTFLGAGQDGILDIRDWRGPFDQTNLVEDIRYLNAEILERTGIGDVLEVPVGISTLAFNPNTGGFATGIFNIPPLEEGDNLTFFIGSDDTIGEGMFARTPAFLLRAGLEGDATRIDERPPAGYVRVVHASPDAGPVDVFVDNRTEPLAEGLEYGDISAFLQAEFGDRTLSIAPAGAGVGAAVLSAGPTEYGVGMGDTTYGTLAVIGEATAAPSTLSLIEREDDFRNVTGDAFRMRVIHAATSFGTVDLLDADNPFDERLLFEDVEYAAGLEDPDDGVTDYGGFFAGSRVFGIDADGDGESDAVYEMPALFDNQNVNLYVLDEGGDLPFLLAQVSDGRAVRVDPRGPRAFIRFAHLSPDGGPVDVYIDDAIDPFREDFLFDEATPFLAFELGTYDVAVAPPDTSSFDAFGRFTVDATEGSLSTVLIGGSGGATPSLTVVGYTTDLSPTTEEAVRVRASQLNGAVSGTLDLLDVVAPADPVAVLDDASLGATTSVELAIGQVRLAVDADADGFSDLVYELGGLADDESVEVALVDGGAMPPFLARLDLDGSVERILPEDPEGYLRVAHLSPGLGALDLYVGGLLVFDDVVFGQGTEYAPLFATTYTFDVRAGDDPPTATPLLSVSGQTIDENTFFTAAAIGSGVATQVFSAQDIYDFRSDGFQDRVVHGSELAPATVGVNRVFVLSGSSPREAQQLVFDGGVADVEVMFGEETLGENTGTTLAANEGGIGVDLSDDANAELVFLAPVAQRRAHRWFITDDGVSVFGLLFTDRGPALRVDPIVPTATNPGFRLVLP
ncbi:MAG: DUF4397 domain-containing protein [Myxococcota bacterium]